MWRVLCMGLVSVLLAGCTSFVSLAETLNARHLASCLKWQGSVSIGAGIGGAGAVQAVTTTGGMTMDDCLKAKDGGLL